MPEPAMRLGAPPVVGPQFGKRPGGDAPSPFGGPGGNGNGMEDMGVDPVVGNTMLLTAVISALINKGALTEEELMAAMAEVVSEGGQDAERAESPLAAGPKGFDQKDNSSGYPGAANAGGNMGEGPSSGGGPGRG